MEIVKCNPDTINEQRKQLRKLILKYAGVLLIFVFGVTSLLKHHIDVGNNYEVRAYYIFNTFKHFLFKVFSDNAALMCL